MYMYMCLALRNSVDVETFGLKVFCSIHIILCKQ